MKKSLMPWLAAFLAAILLSGCLIPEQFTATLDFRTDQYYVFKYKGTAVMPIRALIQKKEGRSLRPDEEKQLEDFPSAWMKNHPEFKKIVRKSDGRYDIEVEDKKRMGQPMDPFGLLRIRHLGEGVISIESQPVDGNSVNDFKSVGVSMNGTFEIRLPNHAEVLSHNATSSQSQANGVYLWNITLGGKTPNLRFKLNRS